MHIASGVWLRKTATRGVLPSSRSHTLFFPAISYQLGACLLYTSDAADDLLCVDLGGRRIIKKKKQKQNYSTYTTPKHSTYDTTTHLSQRIHTSTTTNTETL